MGEHLEMEKTLQWKTMLVAGDGDGRRWWRWSTVLIGGGSSNSKNQIQKQLKKLDPYEEEKIKRKIET
jgi:hypothetical protein